MCAIFRIVIRVYRFMQAWGRAPKYWDPVGHFISRINLKDTVGLELFVLLASLIAMHMAIPFLEACCKR